MSITDLDRKYLDTNLPGQVRVAVHDVAAAQARLVRVRASDVFVLDAQQTLFGLAVESSSHFSLRSDEIVYKLSYGYSDSFICFTAP